VLSLSIEVKASKFMFLVPSMLKWMEILSIPSMKSSVPSRLRQRNAFNVYSSDDDGLLIYLNEMLINAHRIPVKCYQAPWLCVLGFGT
jgi:hypothetical protein